MGGPIFGGGGWWRGNGDTRWDDPGGEAQAVSRRASGSGRASPPSSSGPRRVRVAGRSGAGARRASEPRTRRPPPAYLPSAGWAKARQRRALPPPCPPPQAGEGREGAGHAPLCQPYAAERREGALVSAPLCERNRACGHIRRAPLCALSLSRFWGALSSRRSHALTLPFRACRGGWGRSELDFAVFQGALSACGPWRAGVDAQISPPPLHRFGVPLDPLKQEGHVEHGIGIAGIGFERTIKVRDGLLGATLDIQQICEVVPGLGEARISLHGGPISRLGFEASPHRAQDIAEGEWRHGGGRIHVHRPPIELLRCRGVARRFGWLGILGDGIGILPGVFDVQNELAGPVATTL